MFCAVPKVPPRGGRAAVGGKPRNDIQLLKKEKKKKEKKKGSQPTGVNETRCGDRARFAPLKPSGPGPPVSGASLAPRPAGGAWPGRKGESFTAVVSNLGVEFAGFV